MSGSYEQFYRTWCYSGRSVSGADGWKIRGKSDGLALQEAEGLSDLANYWSPTEFQKSAPPGRRLALFRRPGGSAVAHGAPVAGLVGGRGGVSFEHVVVGLPEDLSALEVLKLWRSSAWRTEDGDFGPKLNRFFWDSEIAGPEFRSSRSVEAESSGGDVDGAIALGFLNEREVMPWASEMLRGCVALSSGEVDKLFVAGRDDTIMRLLFVALYCLPEKLRAKLTFSTHENPKATKGVQIVGVTTLEGADADLPGFCYSGRYCGLNTFTGTKSEHLRSSVFAESAIQWVLYGQYSLLAGVRARFDALDPLDNPGGQELDLLAEHGAAQAGEETGGEGLLKLCGSRAIAHAAIRDTRELGTLLARAQEDGGFEDSLVARLTTWLPTYEAAARDWPRNLARVACERIQEQKRFEDVAWVGKLAGRLGPDFERKFWEALLVGCRDGMGDDAAAAEIPGLEMRLNLLTAWHTGQQLPNDEVLLRRWLRLQPQEFGSVLASSLGENLKREAVRLWLEGGVAEDFRQVVGEARKGSGLGERLATHLAGLAREKGNVLRRFPVELAGMALSDLRASCCFADIEWLGKLAGAAGNGTEERFWEELLAACQAGAGRGLLPSVEIRTRLFEKWEKATRGKNEALGGVLAGCWLRVTSQELLQVLNSGMPVRLKAEAMRLALGRTVGMDTREAEAVFSTLCKDAELTRWVFSEMPGWDGGAVAAKVPENGVAKMLACQNEQMRLADFLDEAVVDTTRFWCSRVPKAVPARMRTRLCFGEHARNPGGFRQVSALDPELTRSEFWAKERDREAAVNGAVDRLLSRGNVGDFERALEWFGEKKWARNAAEVMEIAHRRMVGVPVACKDESLRRLLAFFSAVLSEGRAAGNGAVGAAQEGSNVAKDLREGDYEVLVRIAMRHLPGSSLLKSPSGHGLIEVLHSEKQLVGAVQRGWIESLHSLLEVCNAREFRSEMIGRLARSYVALDKEGDADMRAEINGLLLKLIAKTPQALKLALVEFVNHVYARNEGLFLRGFMPGLIEELIGLERQSEDGAVAGIFVLFCLEGCFLEQGGNFADRRSMELAGWLQRFKRGLTTRSIGRVNRIARVWDSESRERWYRESGFKPSWIWKWRAEAHERREERKLMVRRTGRSKNAGGGGKRLLVVAGVIAAVLVGGCGALAFFAAQKGISLYQQVRELVGH